MVRINVSAEITRATPEGATPPSDSPPQVLELRVHGVNNTTAAALLDVKSDEVEEVAGDKLGSFWRPSAAAIAARKEGQRGYVPPYVSREAYSWGGMVRTTPDLARTGAAATVPAAIARVLYALILPFSIANAAQWTRELDPGAGSWALRGWIALTAGLSRLFSLVLTLLYTATAATLALDVGAAQCGPTPSRCGPIEGLLTAFVEWTPGQRTALFALIPILAVGVLWIFSSISRLRYDVLSGVNGPKRAVAPGVPAPALARAGFWSNRITRALARAHVAAAILLTVILALGYVGPLWGAGTAAAAWAGFLSGFAAFLFIAAAVLVLLLPTGSLTAEDDWRKSVTEVMSTVVLWLAIATTGVGLLLVAFAPAGTTGPDAGTGAAFHALVSAGGVLALTGIAWRRFRGMRRTAWFSAGPFVVMTLALALATAISAIVVVVVRDVVQTTPTGDFEGEAPAALVIPNIYPALGATILLAAAVAAIVIALALIVPKTITARATAWGQATDHDGLDIPDGGVLPPSPKALFARIRDKRRSAARLHLAEPIVGVLTVLLALGLAAGWQWSRAAGADELWQVTELPWLSSEASSQAIQAYLGIAAPVLGWIGAGIVALLVSGAATGGQRPLGIVWDIACFLPRTGHPFGPPCYAERAVPEIAGRLLDWLSFDKERRAVLAAHSMGAVLAVSALGLLASRSETSAVLERVSLLTFGIQLRAYFGRMLPDLLGPAILGVAPSRGPGLLRVDPWKADFEAQQGESTPPAVRAMAGTLLVGRSVPWINLWRLTDYLGFPGVSTARTAVVPGGDGEDVVRANLVDRCAEELDISGYMVEVGTHGEYYRVPAYATALRDLAAPAP